MTKKSSVYTKSGDQGKTGLVGGTRVSKADAQIDLYGEVDELNSFIGLACSYLNEEEVEETLIKDLYSIQNILFDLGSLLACEVSKREKFSLSKIKTASISMLEEKIDEMDAKLEKLDQFILPGGSKESSSFHICRTVCRRLERKMTGNETLPENSLMYINRLSDYFFLCARYINFRKHIKEIVWTSTN